MRDTVLIQRGQLDVLDPVTGLVGGLLNPTLVYQGIGRIRTISEATVNLGGGEIVTRTTVASIPVTAGVPRRDDQLTVLSSASDPQMVNWSFRVLTVAEAGLLAPSRQLTLEGLGPNRLWGG